MRLLIEVVGDGVLRWLFAVMNLAGALTSGIARPFRACKVARARWATAAGSATGRKKGLKLAAVRGG